MGAYRERLLKETYGNGSVQLGGKRQEEESGFLAMFKLKFTICLILFAGFAYMSLTGKNVSGLTAERIVEAVTEEAPDLSFLKELVGMTEKQP